MALGFFKGPNTENRTGRRKWSIPVVSERWPPRQKEQKWSLNFGVLAVNCIFLLRAWKPQGQWVNQVGESASGGVKKQFMAFMVSQKITGQFGPKHHCT